MASPQSPAIYVPTKRTDEVDWTTPLKRYIAAVYQDDPEKYAEEAATLNRLRQDTRGAGMDITGRDLLYRYYGQLELLDLRFPVDENHIKISFTWYDAFTNRPTSQYSLAFEKASVIFNIAATLSAVAATQNRGEPEGRKRAFNFFQAAAGMFSYINDNFLHAPSQDLGRETVKLLVDLMLAQAQECFVENSIRENKKDALIAKLASHAAYVYGTCVDGIQDALNKGLLDRSWLLVCQIKNKYFQAMSQRHRAMASTGEGKYGEGVARYQIAETHAKEASKLAQQLNGSFSHATTPTLPPDTATALTEITKAYLAVCTEEKNTAVKDNDIIYHEPVPNEGVIKPVEKTSAVKTVPISDLYGQSEVQKIIGPDIFNRLIPLSVHESSSMYSEEKAKLVRAEAEKCDIANAELQASLDYMHLPEALNKFRGGADGRMAERSLDELAIPTVEVRQWAEQIKAEEEGSNAVYELLENRDGMRARVAELLDKASMALDEEMRACENMRVKYGEQWAQPPSSQFTAAFRHDLRNHRESLEKATQSDRSISQKYDQNARDISILRGGPNGDDLGRVFVEAVIEPTSDDTAKATQNLLDIEIDTGLETESMERKIKDIENILDKLRKAKKERIDTLQDLKEKTHQDDISHLLLINKMKTNIEPQLFASELEKFRPHQSRIAQTIHYQQQILQELTAAFKGLMSGNEVKKVQSKWDAAERRQKAVISRMNRAKENYHEVRLAASKGLQFYSDLADLAESLNSNVRSFVIKRAEEREDIVRNIERNRSARESELLKEQLSRYGGQPSSEAPPRPPRSSTDGMDNLNNLTRNMSIGPNSGYSQFEGLEAYSASQRPPGPPRQGSYGPSAPPSQPAYSAGGLSTPPAGSWTSPGVSAPPLPLPQTSPSYAQSYTHPTPPQPSRPPMPPIPPYAPHAAPPLPAPAMPPHPPQPPQQISTRPPAPPGPHGYSEPPPPSPYGQSYPSTSEASRRDSYQGSYQWSHGPSTPGQPGPANPSGYSNPAPSQSYAGDYSRYAAPRPPTYGPGSYGAQPPMGPQRHNSGPYGYNAGASQGPPPPPPPGHRAPPPPGQGPPRPPAGPPGPPAPPGGHYNYSANAYSGPQSYSYGNYPPNPQKSYPSQWDQGSLLD
ncbi:hypothetical protein BZG36_00520 [Bifiguratus adelaidae]|uniref:BRO domain-containing protein 1 n=1 Tax=Bifiguratus adelaidae TaxID=1938954 RepID=A0A261Y7F3_9FUNG|nr:hypothetical protein BZG36_00520 [Bifiguratus adelaidae]